MTAGTHRLDWLAGKLARSRRLGNACPGVKGAARELFGRYSIPEGPSR
jgi:hypothetical protein